MAAPSTVTIENLTGKWGLNKALSDNMEPALNIQGVNWLVRKAVTKINVTMALSQHTDPSTGTSVIDIEQKGLGSTSTEQRVIDNETRTSTHSLLGTKQDKCSWVKPSDIGDEYLKSGFEAGTSKLMEVHTESVDNGWMSDQIGGFEVIDGERRYVGRAVFKKGDEVAKIRLVYDWLGAEKNGEMNGSS
ncbi:hypothetical protein K490DRAFT_68671 [Saccharata proteae CBS 121410]|uniref:Uncharacterized protein n=1 Tax=Saccharata proteae CBS 121410 TaxID=1314787 RepID=A0A9P4HQ14_9PEZI|nr:hypothetical protein K490DRAFT_68671 [Saccharata proteae CBS 121410]